MELFVYRQLYVRSHLNKKKKKDTTTYTTKGIVCLVDIQGAT